MDIPGPTPSPLPHVLVFADKYITGINAISDPAEAFPLRPFVDAFSENYRTDAHFVTYFVPGEFTMPRMNKPTLGRIRLSGGDILASMLVLDYDNPGHTPWQPGGVDQLLEKMMTAAASGYPLAMKWSLFYTTAGGARIVYILDRPIPVDQAEVKVAGLVETFARFGVEVDKLCDWTRLFRLPCVTRDRTPTWSADYFIPVEQLDNRILSDEIPNGTVTRSSEYADVRPVDATKPDPDVSRSLMEVLSPQSGKIIMTDWARVAQNALRGRECYDVLFNMRPLADIGERDKTIHRFVGQAVSLLYYREGTTPGHIYALFLPSVNDLEPDVNTRDWTDVLWGAVVRNWAKEDAKHRDQQAKAVKASEMAADMVNSMAGGASQWTAAEEVRVEDPATRLAWLERHMLASIGNHFFVMRPDGYYDPIDVTDRQLIAAIRNRGMDTIIKTTAPNKDGMENDRPVQHIINQYATIVREVQAVPQLPGARIDNVDTAHAVLKIPAYHRNDSLEGSFSPDVDAWLHVMFGDNYAEGVRWIAWSLAFEEGPICALSLKGAAGAGKKMLAQGLAECLVSPALATADDMVSGWSYGLLRSPFLIVNEGWPGAGGKGRHPADQFRALVSGDPLVISTKFRAPINCVNPVRVVFTANNMDVIRMLSSGRELSTEDREALAVRLLHFDIGDRASKWLSEKGGTALTGKPGQRWIRSDGDGESDFVVARHFLHLYRNRMSLGGPGKRFLVEGNASQEILFELRTQSGSSPLVIETILRMVEVSGGQRFEGLAVVNNRLFVLPHEILSFYRKNMEARRELTTYAIANTLKSLSIGEHLTFVLPSRESMGMREWREIDIKLLLDVARAEGQKCLVLETMLRNQQGQSTNVLSPTNINGRVVI